MNKNQLKRWLPIISIFTLLAVFFLLDLGQYLTLETLKQHMTSIQQFSQANILSTGLILFGLYTLITILGLPLASPICIISGFLLPLIPTCISACAAEAIGGTILLKAVQTSLSTFILRSPSKKIKGVIDQMKKNSITYIVSLRFACVFPSSIINIAAGIIRLPAKTYFIVTFFASLPGAFIYAFFGSSLQKTLLSDQPFTLGVIFTPKITLILILLIIIVVATHLYCNRKQK